MTVEQEILLADMRTVVSRLRQIADEVSLAGVVYKHGTIDAAEAREWVESVAPGCLHAVEQSMIPFNAGAA